MLIYDELRKDHRQILALLDRLVGSEKATAADWGQMVDQVRLELLEHSRAEEAILYNALRDSPDERGVVAHSYSEQIQAELLLRRMQPDGAVDLRCVSAARELRDLLAHHMIEEESHVFAAARRVFSTEEAAQMGEAFARMKTSLGGEGFLVPAIDRLAGLMPARLRDSVRKFSTDSSERHGLSTF